MFYFHSNWQNHENKAFIIRHWFEIKKKKLIIFFLSEKSLLLYICKIIILIGDIFQTWSEKGKKKSLRIEDVVIFVKRFMPKLNISWNTKPTPLPREKSYKKQQFDIISFHFLNTVISGLYLLKKSPRLCTAISLNGIANQTVITPSANLKALCESKL